jgi:hypothetical protein
MRLIPILLMTALAWALAACAAGPRPLRGPVPLEWRTLVGCYGVTSGSEEWTFLLDSTASPSEEGARAAQSLRAPRQQDVREYWWVTDRNTVVYRVHEGWGQKMEFVARGDSLVGMHYLFYDMDGWQPRGRVVAVREPCPAGSSRHSVATPRAVDRRGAADVAGRAGAGLRLSAERPGLLRCRHRLAAALDRQLASRSAARLSTA